MDQKPPPSPIFKKFPLKQRADITSYGPSSATQTPRSESPTSDANGKPPVGISSESIHDYSPRKKSSSKRETPNYEYSSDSNLIDSAASKSFSDADRAVKKKKKRIHVVSPLTGEKVYVASEDLIKSRKSKSMSETSESIEMVYSMDNFQDINSDDVIVPVEEQTEVLFVSDGKQYRPKDRATIKLEKEEIIRTAGEQKRTYGKFADKFKRRREKFFDFCLALYAGACLFSIILLPIQSFYSPATPIVPIANCSLYPVPPPEQVGLKVGRAPMPLFECKITPTSQFGSPIPTGTFDQGYLVGFLLLYSPSAANLNALFQAVGIVCFLATWGKTAAIMQTPKRGIRKMLYLSISIMGLISSILSYSAVNLMSFIDSNLTFSQGALPSYGIYGTQNWFFNPSALLNPAVVMDLNNWTMLNGLRGVTGILTFLFWSLVKEYDSEANNKAISTNSSTPKITPS